MTFGLQSMPGQGTKQEANQGKNLKTGAHQTGIIQKGFKSLRQTEGRGLKATVSSASGYFKPCTERDKLNQNKFRNKLSPFFPSIAKLFAVINSFNTT